MYCGIFRDTAVVRDRAWSEISKNALVQLKLSLDREDSNPIDLARQRGFYFHVRYIDSNDRLMRSFSLSGAESGIDTCDALLLQDFAFDPLFCTDGIVEGVNGNLLSSEHFDSGCSSLIKDGESGASQILRIRSGSGSYAS
jgi:hypothetical protein